MAMNMHYFCSTFSLTWLCTNLITRGQKKVFIKNTSSTCHIPSVCLYLLYLLYIFVVYCNTWIYRGMFCLSKTFWSVSSRLLKDFSDWANSVNTDEIDESYCGTKINVLESILTSFWVKPHFAQSACLLYP